MSEKNHLKVFRLCVGVWCEKYWGGLGFSWKKLDEYEFNRGHSVSSGSGKKLPV